jgi:hypothetical protein
LIVGVCGDLVFDVRVEIVHNFFWLLLVGVSSYLVFGVGGHFVNNFFWLRLITQSENLKKEENVVKSFDK